MEGVSSISPRYWGSSLRSLDHPALINLLVPWPRPRKKDNRTWLGPRFYRCIPYTLWPATFSNMASKNVETSITGSWLSWYSAFRKRCVGSNSVTLLRNHLSLAIFGVAHGLAGLTNQMSPDLGVNSCPIMLRSTPLATQYNFAHYALMPKKYYIMKNEAAKRLPSCVLVWNPCSFERRVRFSNEMFTLCITPIWYQVALGWASCSTKRVSGFEFQPRLYMQSINRCVCNGHLKWLKMSSYIKRKRER